MKQFQSALPKESLPEIDIDACILGLRPIPIGNGFDLRLIDWQARGYEGIGNRNFDSGINIKGWFAVEKFEMCQTTFGFDIASGLQDEPKMIVRRQPNRVRTIAFDGTFGDGMRQVILFIQRQMHERPDFWISNNDFQAGDFFDGDY